MMKTLAMCLMKHNIFLPYEMYEIIIDFLLPQHIQNSPQEYVRKFNKVIENLPTLIPTTPRIIYPSIYSNKNTVKFIYRVEYHPVNLRRSIIEHYPREYCKNKNISDIYFNYLQANLNVDQERNIKIKNKIWNN